MIGTGPEFKVNIGAGDTRVVKYGSTTSIQSNFTTVVTDFTLDQNYPNPFNPTTVIRFSIPVAAHVSLIIYDLLGREILRLIDGKMNPGKHTVNCNLSGLPSGVYIYRIITGQYVQQKKMISVR
jgi:hypothetical protein